MHCSDSREMTLSYLEKRHLSLKTILVTYSTVVPYSLQIIAGAFYHTIIIKIVHVLIIFLWLVFPHYTFMSLLDCQCPILLLGYCQMYHKVCDPLSQPFHNILILSNQFQSPATAVLLKSDIIFPTSVAFPQSVKKFRDYI